MVTATENHHVDMPHEMLGMTGNNMIVDLFEVIFRPDLVTLASVMTWNVITMDHTKTAYDAAIVMTKNKIGSVIITAYEKPFGIVTEKDLVRISAFLGVPVESLILSYIASRPLICAKPTQTIQEASYIMREYDIDHLPILEKDKIIGMITSRDLAMYLI